ncbi:hypothetical protein D9M71_395480 [compost metagenome]
MEMADCTPSVFCSFHASSSMADRVPNAEQPSASVFTITTSTSELVEKFLMMKSLSRL